MGRWWCLSVVVSMKVAVGLVGPGSQVHRVHVLQRAKQLELEVPQHLVGNATRRSRLHRLEASTRELEASPNATRVRLVATKLRDLSEHSTLGPAMRSKLENLTGRLEVLEEEKKQRLRIGDVVTGTCVELRPFGAMIAIPQRSRPALLHKSEVSSARVQDLGAVIPVGATIKCAVVSVDEKSRISVSTKILERQAGAMLRDPGFVYQQAPHRVHVGDRRKSKRVQANAVTSSVVDLAATASLDDLDRQIASIHAAQHRRDARFKDLQNATPPTTKAALSVSDHVVPAPAKAPQEGTTADTMSIASAFQAPAVAKKQRDEEFELMMRDIIYEQTPSTLSGMAQQLLGGRKKRGSFKSPFWTKLFPRDVK